MHRKRLRITQKPEQAILNHHLSTMAKLKPWSRALLAGAALGAASGYLSHESKKSLISRERKAAEESLKENIPSARDKTLVDWMTLENKLGIQSKVKEGVLSMGGWTAGDFQWALVKLLLDRSGGTLGAHDLDLGTPTLFKDSAKVLKRDYATMFRRYQYISFRKDALSRDMPDKKQSEERLKERVRREIEATASLEKAESDSGSLLKESVALGTIIGSLPMLAVLAATLFRSIKSSLALRRLGPDASIADASHLAPAGGIEKPEASSIAAPDASIHIPSADRTDQKGPSACEETKVSSGKREGSGNQEVLDLAKKMLETDFGKGVADAIITVLNGKLSSTMARKVVEGDLSSLKRLVAGSKKALEHKGFDSDAIVRTLNGEEPAPDESAAGETQPAGSERKAKRRPHPLDLVKRWGWKPNNFHNLLRDWGFNTDEVGGGTHNIVKYQGEILRQANGVPVMLTRRTSGTEIKPGLAHAVLKHCAEYLAAREADSGNDNPGA
jgi:hypothetical protein